MGKAEKVHCFIAAMLCDMQSQLTSIPLNS